MEKTSKKKINFLETCFQNKNLLVNNYLTKIFFQKALLNKGVILCKFNLNMLNNVTIVYVESFFRTAKIIKYKRMCRKKKLFLMNKNKLIKNTLLFNPKLNSTLDTKNIHIKLTAINKLINKKKLITCFLKFRGFIPILFSRGFNLFIDFLKITVLLSKNKVAPKIYLLILAQIFKNLTKKKHTRFVFFFKTVFNYLISSSEITGIKLVINGKLSGKTRANTIKVEKGSISINTQNSNLNFDKIHVYTLYGVFGFKLWLNYK